MKIRVDVPRSLLSCAPISCRNVWVPCSSSLLFFMQQQTSEKKLSSSSKKKIRMASLALQKLVLKDLVCLPLYRKQSPKQILIGSAPNMSPNRSMTQYLSQIRSLIPAPYSPPPYWILQDPIRQQSYSKQDCSGAHRRGACQGPGPTWETPRSGWVGFGLPWMGVGHISGQYINLCSKSGSIREGKTTNMV